MDDVIDIREVSSDEVGILGHIIRESFRGQAALLGISKDEYPSFVEFMTDEAVRKDIENGNRPFLLFSEGRPVGTLWYRLELKEHGVATLRKLGVLPGFRGRGYGERLFECAEQRLRDLAISHARLGCNAEFPRLRAYYARLGYAITRRETYPTLPFEVLTMEKDLTRR